MSSDPQAPPPPYDEQTQQALRRLSEVVFRALERLDRLERGQQTREGQPGGADDGEHGGSH